MPTQELSLGDLLSRRRAGKMGVLIVLEHGNAVLQRNDVMLVVVMLVVVVQVKDVFRTKPPDEVVTRITCMHESVTRALHET